MPSTQEFRRRIKSVNNTKQITKAMEMVASVKMQKAVQSILRARTYVQESWNMLVKLARLTLPENHPLLLPNAKSEKIAVIFVASDRGLCGSYNSDLLKKLISFTKEEDSKNIDVIAVGKKAAEVVKRYNIANLTAAFDGFENEFELDDIVPISKLSNGEYLNGNYKKVVIIYSHFQSSLKQIPVVKQILPIDQNHLDLPDLWESKEIESNLEYQFEPNPDAIFDKLLRRIIRLQIFGAVLEANASEHSARMVAMKNATDNAKNLISELTLTYNTIRQNSITNEIAEISAAAEAMK